MSWSAGSEIPPMFERAFMAWNKHLDEVKPGMKRPVLKRVESDILCGAASDSLWGKASQKYFPSAFHSSVTEKLRSSSRYSMIPQFQRHFLTRV